MKRKILLFTVSAAILSITIMSYKDGPAAVGGANGTGGPGSNTTCGSAGCHAGGAGTTTGEIQLRKLSTGVSGPVVSSYEPDTMYIVRITGNNSNLSHFGFQLQALNSSNADAGTFSNFSGVHTEVIGGKTIVEHSAPLAKTAGVYDETFNWKAPATGTGNVTFYGVINGVNNNNSTSGDKPSSPLTKVLNEHTTSVAELDANINITTYPNPVSNQLNIKMENAKGAYSLNVFDMNGKKVVSKDVQVTDAAYETAINTANWAAGLYHVQLSKDGAQRTIAVVKQ